MIVPRRRLHFQLTPLLDLLLIVIFAQYMDVQQTAQREESMAAEQVSSARDRLDELQQQLDALRSAQARRKDELDAYDERLEQARLRNRELADEMARRKIESDRARQRLRKQRDLIGELATELFAVPDDVVARVKQSSSPEELEQIRRRLREMAAQQGSRMVRHLLAYEELRKRCDIWDVYIAENGLITVSTGTETDELRAATAGQFADGLFEWYKSLPQPKSLVIILVSYGDAKAEPRAAVLGGLPEATERMRADSNGRTRFEYADIGYSPDRPARTLP